MRTWVGEAPDDVERAVDGGDGDLGAAVRHEREGRPLPRLRVVALRLRDEVPHAVRVRRVVVDAARHVQLLYPENREVNCGNP